MAKHRFNWALPAAVVLSAATFLSFRRVFVWWPATRDVPWANLLLFAASVTLLWRGTRQAIAPGPRRLLRVIGGSMAFLVSAAALALFVYAVLIAPRMMPASANAPKVGDRAPDISLVDIDGKPVVLRDLLTQPMPLASGASPDQTRPPKGTLLIFYMYRQCLACNSELHDMQEHLQSLTDAGIRVIAISNDPPAETKLLLQEAGYSFTFLSDPTSEAIRRYDVLNDDGATARAADFLIDSSGTVEWRMLTNDYYVRARPAHVLDAAKMLR